MNKEEIVEGLLLEMRRATIVISVLSQLEQPTYGYNLIQLLAQKQMNVEANTLYPLLRRLEGQGLLESSWLTGEGKPRKYYKRTALGNDVYTELKLQWEATTNRMAFLLEG